MYNGFDSISLRVDLPKNLTKLGPSVKPTDLLQRIKTELEANYKNTRWQNGVELSGDKIDNRLTVRTNYQSGVGMLESVWFEVYITTKGQKLFCFLNLTHFSVSLLKKPVSANINTIDADFRAFIAAIKTILKS